MAVQANGIVDHAKLGTLKFKTLFKVSVTRFSNLGKLHRCCQRGFYGFAFSLFQGFSSGEFFDSSPESHDFHTLVLG